MKNSEIEEVKLIQGKSFFEPTEISILLSSYNNIVSDFDQSTIKFSNY